MTVGRKILPLLVTGIMMSSCVGSIPITREQAEQIADAHVASDAPHFRDIMTRTSVEQGRYWVVVYQLNPDHIGGAPTIWVRKSNGRIARAAYSQ
jgi:hypothetical protein